AKLDASKASLDSQTSPDAIDKDVKPGVDKTDADIKKLKGDVELLEKLLDARRAVKADITKANDELSRVRDHV
ncbi:hypothetical protein ACQ7B2_09685, partial [Escherichia coli]